MLAGDPLRLGQILNNLCNNALKFSEHGDIAVGAWVEEEDEREIVLHFFVRDSGVGIAVEKQAQLFNPFSQADASTTRKFGGTGLGLVICKRLAEMMHGLLWLNSAYGEGSEFHFTARFGKIQENTTEHTVETVSDELQGIRILMAADNPVARRLLGVMLESFGMRVTSVEDGLTVFYEIFEAAQTEPFKLVLLDWQLPGMDSVGVVSRLQGVLSKENMPRLLILYAHDRGEIGEYCETLHKPLTRSSLQRSLKQVLGKAELDDAGTSTEAAQLEQAVSTLRGVHLLLVEDNDYQSGADA
ncbi:MAG: ATP-binding protein [Mariprofundaceae bacterium]|nr:ATP-binding protein [Mariprofundaceae bacterium]